MTSAHRPILVTGFEKYLHFPHNPSSEGLLRLFEQRKELAQVAELVVLPVTFADAANVLREAANRVRPKALLSFGMHGGKDSTGRDRKTFFVERFAYNEDRCVAPDNHGQRRDGTPIDSGLPLGAAVASGLSPQLLFDAIAASCHSVEFSDNPGRYLCNHVFWCASHCMKAYHQDTLAGFVHVPPDAAFLDNGLDADAYPTVFASCLDALLFELGLDLLRR